MDMNDCLMARLSSISIKWVVRLGQDITHGYITLGHITIGYFHIWLDICLCVIYKVAMEILSYA